MKISYLVLIVILAALLPFKPAQADDETVKALIGGVVGMIAAEAIKEATTPERTKEEIQWNTPLRQSNDNIACLMAHALSFDYRGPRICIIQD